MRKQSVPPPPATIFDQFLIVGLKEGMYYFPPFSLVAYVSSFVENKCLIPNVLYSFPSAGTPPNVALFCFPEDINYESVNKIKSYVQITIYSIFYLSYLFSFLFIEGHHSFLC